MSEILDLATRLGKAIAESPESQKLRTARAALDQHADLKQLLGEFQAQSEKIDMLEEEGKPIEPADKQKLQQLHDKLVASEVFKKYTATQMEFIDLMRKVNQSISQHLDQA